jgi:hypothetical protein
MDLVTAASVYGVARGPGGRTAEPVRLGAGRLVHPQVVIAQPDLAGRIDSEPPPEVLRVGLAALVGGRLLVDVVEVVGVHRSRPGVRTSWAVELRRAVALPASAVERPQSVFGDPSDFGFPGRPTDPLGLICFLFRGLKICRDRDVEDPEPDPPDR